MPPGGAARQPGAPASPPPLSSARPVSHPEGILHSPSSEHVRRLGRLGGRDPPMKGPGR